jgi:hypothetical protein
MNVCLACGFPGLYEPPRSATAGGGSYEICPSCGFQFGVTDEDDGYSYVQWREKWIAEGMEWVSVSRLPPQRWNPVSVLQTFVRSEQ